MLPSAWSAWVYAAVSNPCCPLLSRSEYRWAYMQKGSTCYYNVSQYCQRQTELGLQAARTKIRRFLQRRRFSPNLVGSHSSPVVLTPLAFSSFSHLQWCIGGGVRGYTAYTNLRGFFHSRLKSFLFCKSSLPSLSFFSFRIHYMDFPYYCYFWAYPSFYFLVFLFLHIFSCRFRAVD